MFLDSLRNDFYTNKDLKIIPTKMWNFYKSISFNQSVQYLTQCLWDFNVHWSKRLVQGVDECIK